MASVSNTGNTPPINWSSFGLTDKQIDELRAMPELAECRLLARGNRLSVMPIADDEFDAIVAYSKTKNSKTKKKKR